VARGPKKTTDNDAREKLIAALKFACIAVNKEDNSGLSQFATVKNGFVVTENDTLCIGVPVETDLHLVLHADKFHSALIQCSPAHQMQMVQLNDRELSIKSGNFRGVVPLLPNDTIADRVPDAACGQLGQSVITGFTVLAKLCNGKTDRIYDQSIWFRSQSMIATNGAIGMEYWHGFHLPHSMNIPKKTVETLAKIEKPLVSFGFSANSITFYFDDNSFLKSRLLSGEWPDRIVTIFEKAMAGDFNPLWIGFADALTAVAKFVENDTIVFHLGTLSTSENLEHAAASYLVERLPQGHKFSHAYWKMALPFAEFVKLPDKKDEPTAFKSSRVRGVIMGKH
jgi:hypothetical protein